MSEPVNRGRVAAAHALMAVETGRHAEEVLSESLPEGDDGRLAWHLAFGVLRHRARVDAALRDHLKVPLASLDRAVRATLRLGAFEKLFARTPDHAVVQQAVELIRILGAPRASGLVNAILRRVSPASPLRRHELLDHPAWLVDRWDQRYGAEAVTAWCERDGTVPPVCLVGRDAASLSEAVGEVNPAMLHGQPLALTHQSDSKPEGFENHPVWVQDPAAVAVADLLADAVGQGSVLDACAAPGGKALRLWSRGLDVTASDLKKRIPLLQSSLERLGAEVRTVAHDWSRPAALGTFDGVLLDAPCTGLGVTRRHPEIRWRRHATDLAQIQGTQRRILNNLMSCVKPGGFLVYAVCSPEPEEGEHVIEPFLESSGFVEVRRFTTAPPTADEDVHQAFLLQRPEDA